MFSYTVFKDNLPKGGNWISFYHILIDNFRVKWYVFALIHRDVSRKSLCEKIVHLSVSLRKCISSDENN